MAEVKPLRIGNGVILVEVEETDVELPARTRPSVGEGQRPDTPSDGKLVGFHDDLEQSAS